MRYLRVLADLVVGVVVLPAAILAALAARRRRPKRPRVLFGTSPLINTKYWSHALRTRGYEASSYASDVYAIFRREDFDFVASDFLPRLSRFALGRLIRRYAIFLWALRSFDVFVLDFDGGFLRHGPLEFFELPLLRLARRPVIAIPYGADVIDIRRCPDERTRAALLRDYPDLEAQATSTARRVRHYGRWVSLVICGGNMLDYAPRCDVLLPSCLAIDAEEWRANRDPPAAGPVKILHAPNHRAIKGTEHLVRACSRLQEDGLPVELVLLEGVPNQEIRRTMEDVHVVASAFVMGYYELFAVEGMSMSRPVLNYWRPDLLRLHAERSFAEECPIVDAPIERLEERIRELVVDPELRGRLGAEGRRYVERHHSYEAMGAVLDDAVRRVWQ